MGIGTDRNASREEKQWHQAVQMAKRNFGYFLREVFWNPYQSENELEFAAVLFEVAEEQEGKLVCERLWLSEIQCDGISCYGRVLNQPEKLRHTRQGMNLKIPTKSLEDWVYVINGKAYGGYTVNLRRSKLETRERSRHDVQWGYDFGDPLKVENYPSPQPPEEIIQQEEEAAEPVKFFGMSLSSPSQKREVATFFGMPLARSKTLQSEAAEADKEANTQTLNQRFDHPLALEFQQVFVDYFEQHPSDLDVLDSNGNAPIHVHALVGNRHLVEHLIKMGASFSLLNKAGASAKELAKMMGWVQVVSIISAAERNTK